MTNESDFVTLSAKPNSPVLGKKLGKDFAAFRPLIEKLSSTDVQKIEDGGTITLNGVNFDSTEILVFRTAKEGTQAVTNRFVTIDLDCSLDQDLIDEGLVSRFRYCGSMKREQRQNRQDGNDGDILEKQNGKRRLS